jgi:hypothetical protein
MTPVDKTTSFAALTVYDVPVAEAANSTPVAVVLSKTIFVA